MYFLGVLRPDDVAQAYAKDAVIFIFGVLAMAMAISKTGLDRRIGLLLLGPAKSLPRFLFLFLPMIGMACSFLSEHALVAFLDADADDGLRHLDAERRGSARIRRWR